MSTRDTILSLTLVIVASTMSLAEDQNDPTKPVDKRHAEKMAAGLALFKSEVRPVLMSQCLRCHGGEDTEADFDLSTRKLLLKGGETGKAVLAGDAKSSRLMKLIKHEVEPEMPVDASKLKAEQIAAIAKWIDLGAPYDAPLTKEGADETPWTERVVTAEAKQYWAFQPLGEFAPPVVQNRDWGKTEVDSFVLNKLESLGIKPNQVADKRVLIRRVYLDLLGMPPTTEEVKAFVANNDPDAYSKLIDRLLKSPHYGERWGRHWLDLARFAESHGFEQDYDRPHAFHYRDFVIKALNADMPYDQFVRWQLAGDELAPTEPLAMAATGFLGAGVFPTQLTEKEFEPARYDELADMTGTMGAAMLGMTIGCARCHDHKFDPIPQADFYRIASSFTTTVRSEIDLKTKPVGLDKYLVQHQVLVDALKQYEQQELVKKTRQWVAMLKPSSETASVWRVLSFQKQQSEGGAIFKANPDGSLLATGPSAKNDRYTFVARTTAANITAVRLEALADKSLVRSGPGRASNGNFALSDFRVTASPLSGKGEAVAVKLINPRATFQQNNSSLSVAGSIDNDPVSGWAVDPQFGKNHAAAFDFAEPLPFTDGAILTFTLHFNNNVHHSIGRPRLSISTLANPPLDGTSTLQLSPSDILKLINDAGGFDQLDADNKRIIVSQFGVSDPTWQKLNARVQQSWNDRPQGTSVRMQVTSEGVKPMKHHADGRGFTHFFQETYFLNRGDTAQKEGIATQGFMQALISAPEKEQRWIKPAPQDARTSGRRTALANWMTDTEAGAGHLLARVIVNRLWQHHFGRGIVETPNDFGVQGTDPTHAELLDWLASRLIENGWRLKPIHKLMMTSTAYMQSSEFNPESSKADLRNQYLWRFSPRRLEAEAIRDSILAVSGELDETMYGKGTLNESMKRRSIYFFIKRSKLIPMMQLFDSPESLVSIGERPATTIAPQALLFMNNLQVRRYAQSFATRLAAEPTLSESIQQGYLATVARLPTTAELTEGEAFLREQIASYESDKLPKPREMAMADFCQVLFSLNEFIYVE